MSFGLRRGSSSDDVPPQRTRVGSLSSRAYGVPSVVGTTKRVVVVANNSQNPTAVVPGVENENNVKRAAFGSSTGRTTGGGGKENVARTGPGSRPSSARPASRVSVERAPLQVPSCGVFFLFFFFFPLRSSPPPTRQYEYLVVTRLQC